MSFLSLCVCACVYVCVRVIVSMRFQCVCIHVNMRLLRVGEEGLLPESESDRYLLAYMFLLIITTPHPFFSLPLFHVGT